MANWFDLLTGEDNPYLQSRLSDEDVAEQEFRRRNEEQNAALQEELMRQSVPVPTVTPTTGPFSPSSSVSLRGGNDPGVLNSIAEAMSDGVPTFARPTDPPPANSIPRGTGFFDAVRMAGEGRPWGDWMVGKGDQISDRTSGFGKQAVSEVPIIGKRVTDPRELEEFKKREPLISALGTGEGYLMNAALGGLAGDVLGLTGATLKTVIPTAARTITNAAKIPAVQAAALGGGGAALAYSRAKTAEAETPAPIVTERPPSYADLIEKAGLPPAQARALSEQMERFHGAAAAAQGGSDSQIKTGDRDNPGGDISPQEFTGAERVVSKSSRPARGIPREEIARLLEQHGLTDEGLTKNVITLRGDRASLSSDKTKDFSRTNAPIAPWRTADLTEREKMERLEAIEEKKRGYTDFLKEQYETSRGEEQMRKAYAGDPDKFMQYAAEAHPEVVELYKRMMAAVPKDRQDVAKQNFFRQLIPHMARDRAAARLGKDPRGVREFIDSLAQTSVTKPQALTQAAESDPGWWHELAGSGLASAALMAGMIL